MNIFLKSSTDSVNQTKLQLSLYYPFRSSFKTVYDFAEQAHVLLKYYNRCSCGSALQMPDKKRLESPLGVWTNLEWKTSSAFLPAKQARTGCSSSDFNVKFLHDWSNFDLPKLMSIEHNSFDRWIMVVSRLFTVPYFFVRSFRNTASYRHGYLDCQMY